MADDGLVINRALRNSFSHVKEDITSLQRQQEQETAKLSDLQKDIEKIISRKEERVTPDELLVVKNKLSEMQILLRKISVIDERINKIEKTKADRSSVEKENSRMNELLSLKLSQVDTTLDTFRNFNKQFITKEHTQKLLKEIGTELTDIWGEIHSIEKVKDQITVLEVHKRTDALNKKIQLLSAGVNQVTKNLESRLAKSDFNDFVRSLNQELVLVKKQQEDISKLKMYLQHLREEFVTVDEFNKKIIEFNSSIDLVQKDTNTFRKETVDRKELTKLLQEVRSVAEGKVESVLANFNRRITEFNNSLESIRNDTNIFRRETLDKREFVKSHAQLQKNVDERFLKMQNQFNKILSELDKNFVSKKEHKNEVSFAEREVSAELQFKKEKNKGSLLFFGNLCIITGFLSLVAGIVTYFMQEAKLTNYFALGAIIVFILGLILRVFSLNEK